MRLIKQFIYLIFAFTLFSSIQVVGISEDGLSFQVNYASAAQSSGSAFYSSDMSYVKGNTSFEAVIGTFTKYGTFALYVILIPVGLGLFVKSLYGLTALNDINGKKKSITGIIAGVFVAVCFMNLMRTHELITGGGCSEAAFYDGICFEAAASGLAGDELKRVQALSGSSDWLAEAKHIESTVGKISSFISFIGMVCFARGLYYWYLLKNGQPSSIVQDGGGCIAILVASAILFDHIRFLEMLLSTLRTMGVIG